ncbi:hypothetical protein [Psychromicrobium xiongbiense]|uniref:hypothetical protein n=1 Tax=Psychromicrobium xiongbiense TaxID=3051184 RepID=UPI0025558609|nr:hypothetical protein [Psychromicrobium sp. YIM S02556]
MLPSNRALFWEPLRRFFRPLAGSPWWLRIGLIYLATRMVSGAIFAGAALQQGPNPWFPPQPDYLHFLGIWDSEWYQRIFDSGYPSVLPRDTNGAVQQNTWAFYPVFPLLVRGLAVLTGGSWLILAPIVATLAGLAASLICYRLFRHFTKDRTATWGVMFLLTFPASAILQVPYAESINLAFLAGALLLVLQRRYYAAVPLILLADLSRPVGSAFALFAVLHVVTQLWPGTRSLFGYLPWQGGSRQSGDLPSDVTSFRQSGFRLPGFRQGGGMAVMLLASLIGAAAWPVIAWWATGVPSAYTDTETTWRGGPLVLFQPWLAAAQQYLGLVGGIAGVVLLLLAFLVYFNSAAVRRIGLDLRLWGLSYTAYLAAVLHPQTSTFRLLLPLFPFALATAFLVRSTRARWVVLILFLLLQMVWVVWLWAWAPLPGGGDYPP